MLKISVITPSYNQGQFLEETMQSVIGQGYPGLEYIVIDGGSRDNSVEVIKKYERHLAYWVSEKDKGQSDAINKGFTRATGDIVTWVNSDDLLLPGALQKIAELFSLAPENVGVIHGGTVTFKDGKDTSEVFTYGIPSVEKFLSGMGFSQPAAFFRKSFLDKAGLLREDLHYGMDYDLFARLACIGRFQAAPYLFSKYRLHDESKSVAHSDKFRNDWTNVFLSLCSYLVWDDVLEKLPVYLPGISTDSIYCGYRFQPDRQLLKQVNRQKVLFYFLSDSLLHYYWNDQREEARVLFAKMKRDFPGGWFQEDPRVTSVISKLKLPDGLLRTLKRIKNVLR